MLIHCTPCYTTISMMVAVPHSTLLQATALQCNAWQYCHQAINAQQSVKNPQPMTAWPITAAGTSVLLLCTSRTSGCRARRCVRSEINHLRYHFPPDRHLKRNYQEQVWKVQGAHARHCGQPQLVELTVCSCHHHCLTSCDASNALLHSSQPCHVCKRRQHWRTALHNLHTREAHTLAHQWQALLHARSCKAAGVLEHIKRSCLSNKIWAESTSTCCHAAQPPIKRCCLLSKHDSQPK
ncbi:hypothetical protein COO60DRAFT_1096491 [Scenedesmus sp. NREL 46B-D3]|nr:hypothetical protein COO60DRAFT_1096491 [Scenedesmus sp. NREL 46B-D3]